MLHKRIIFVFLGIAGFTLTGCNFSPRGDMSNGGKSGTPTSDYAVTPNINLSDNMVTYGIYPQTVVDNQKLITNLENKATLDNRNGYYLYQNNYYACLNADPYRDYYTFDNGRVINSGQKYWFKCEPIVWKVLSNSNNRECFVLSNKLLDVHAYSDALYARYIDDQSIYPNNYKYSDIRSWLNDYFYNSAFALGNTAIQTTTVDNTSYVKADFACENTLDKVFLPSAHEYFDESYGFDSIESNSNVSRYCETTDWARAKGAELTSQTGDYANMGDYWTRSPYDHGDEVRCISYGGFFSDTVRREHYCVRPALTLYI